MNQITRIGTILCGVLLCSLVSAAHAQPSVIDPTTAVRQIWQLLDYVSVDYQGAVLAGKVTSETEFAEMRDFTRRADQGMRDLPATAEQPEILALSALLVSAVNTRADPAEVASSAQTLATRLLQAYPIPAAPHSAPDLARGGALYQAQCGSCHGALGAGDGPLAAQLDPPPVAFTDRQRAGSRSLLGLYQVISQGMAGTAMPSFDTLSDEDRWALAYFVGTLSYDEGMRARGKTLWQADASRFGISDLTQLTAASARGLGEQAGFDDARDVLAYLRSHPEALQPDQVGSTALARQRLKDSLAALGDGNKTLAVQLALSSYLDGIEPLEPMLMTRAPQLMVDIEGSMLAYRNAASDGSVERAAGLAKQLDQLMLRAQLELGEHRNDTASSTFVGAFTILLREGLEALLVVVGMLAFLKKAKRTEVLPYVHAGWVAALVLGCLTWVAATYVVHISGASRELTEGVSSIFAAVVLLGVGLWMHQKSTAGRWQAYIKGKLSAAMSRRSAFALFALAFVTVYREVFETVLFYSALWVQGNGHALLAGLGAGVASLGVTTWVLLRTSAKMPIGKFFSISSVLVAVLAVVLAGKGVVALQEAGVLGATAFAGPRIEVLGIFPFVEPVVTQLVVVLIAGLGFAANAIGRRRALAVPVT